MFKNIFKKFKKKNNTQQINKAVVPEEKYIFNNDVIAYKTKNVIDEIKSKYKNIVMTSVVDVKFEIYNKDIEFITLMPTISNSTGEVNVRIEDILIEGDLLVSISAFDGNGNKIEDDIKLKFKNAKIDTHSNKITVDPNNII
ncbi:hypothetical protein FJQ98_16030 [Lysinibacillus agricola]|uniref:Uncharacterized protein n=1 Tax=Lysinibacillus agricola TaxID=2590012 RepID=A0ABX7AM33_9BACI|nr:MULTISPECIES: hypothetical protein [Lysinibacillus]KOS61547.1 hypothetical protein AN161_18330 [Lysinibacillus sp. FJAT-14222]QQP10754.1 hypothetical protein FJQ98_16030 [Lysinibacillus agricola]